MSARDDYPLLEGPTARADLRRQMLDAIDWLRIDFASLDDLARTRGEENERLRAENARLKQHYPQGEILRLLNVIIDRDAEIDALRLKLAWTEQISQDRGEENERLRIRASQEREREAHRAVEPSEGRET